MSLKTANFNYFLLVGIHFVSINVVVYLLFEFEVEFEATHRFVHFYLKESSCVQLLCSL